MAKALKFHMYIGSETGFLKGVNLSNGQHKNLNKIAVANRDEEITCMCWKTADSEEEFYVGLRNGEIRSFNPRNETSTCNVLPPMESGEGQLCSVASVDNRLITAVDTGTVKIWDVEANCKATLSCGTHLARMRLHPKESLVVTGGKESELRLWDLSQPDKPLFIAKNVRPDWLQLQVPVYPMDFAFLGRLIASSTANARVRLYDPSVQRRPILELTVGEHPIGTICFKSEWHVVIGNALGLLSLIDLRKPGRVVHHLKGAAGSIRDAVVHPLQPLVVSCGLDRYARLHDVDNKKLLRKIYLKSRLNCLLLKSDLVEEDQEDSEESEDELWKELQDQEQEDEPPTEKKKRRT